MSLFCIPGRAARPLCALVAFSAMLCVDRAAADATELEAAYVVMNGQGAVARAVTKAAECPTIAIDGNAPQPMNVRAQPDTGKGAQFPVLVCELAIPSGASSATLADQSLPLPPAQLDTIVGLGDTGCRLKAKKAKASDEDDDEEEEVRGKFQKCDKKKKWPFARISKSAAAATPDLVIHVGDYYYRESACPKGNTGCEGSPHGNNWKTWKADFFAPAAPLLQAAPWIMTRGNHESCARGGAGYLRFLDPRLAQDGKPPECTDLAPTYTVTVGGQSFIVLDSSNAEDTCGDDGCDSAPYAAEFEAMTPAVGAWLISHKPIWGFKNDDVTLNDTLQDALAQSKGKPPAGISLVLSGHIHLWEALSFADGRAPQFVLGNGGTKLAHKIEQPLEGEHIGGTKVAFGRSERVFGFTTFVPANNGSGWTATLNDSKGNELVSCTIAAGDVECN